MRNTGNYDPDALVEELILGGRLKANTVELRRLMGLRQARDAEAFNDRVADACGELDGLIVRRRVKKLAHMRIARADGSDLGDIDVRAVDPASRTVWPIETKDLAVARTPAELANELAETFGTEGRRMSAVQRHAERTAWLRRNLPAVLGALGLSQSDSAVWKVRPLVVVSQQLLSPFVAPPPIRVILFRQLRAVLAGDSDRPRSYELMT